MSIYFLPGFLFWTTALILPRINAGALTELGLECILVPPYLGTFHVHLCLEESMDWLKHMHTKNVDFD